MLKKALCYKLNGIGINVHKKGLRKKLLENNLILKIIVIAAYKKEKGYPEILKVAEMLKKRKIKIDCYGYGNYEKFNSIKNKKKK